MERDRALIYRLLDTEAGAFDEMPKDQSGPGMANRMGSSSVGGLTDAVKLELSPFLSTEKENSLLIDCLVNPQIDSDDLTKQKAIKRSYRVMCLLMQDFAALSKHQPTLLKLNPTQAKLLVKKLYSGYRISLMNNQNFNSNDEIVLPHLPHLNKTLISILHAFPSAVVEATCAGGKEGFELNFTPMIQLHQSLVNQKLGHIASPLSTMVEIILTGCTGRKQTNNNLQNQQQQMFGGIENTVCVSQGHRRKFVHSLSEWGLFPKLIDCVTSNKMSGDSMDTTLDGNALHQDLDCFVAENMCDTVLEIVNTLSLPHLNMNEAGDSNGSQMGSNETKEDSVGEEELLSPLATEDIVQKLVSGTIDQDLCSTNSICASSRTLSTLFEIATGKTQKKVTAPSMDAAEEGEGIEAKVNESDGKENSAPIRNRLMKSGFTKTMHKTLVSKVEVIIYALDLEACRKKQTPSHSAVRHPGGYIIERPFTSRRLHLLTLLTDVICFTENDPDSDKNRSSASLALDALMKLPLHVENQDSDREIVLNPWPALCDILFEYSENSMYQNQFYRLVHGLCMANHEDTLKLVVQKCKFISRAIKACSVKNEPQIMSTRGVLLRCLNALRLHSQSLSQKSFLRHYLESHDGWKVFQEDLIRITKEQVGGLAIRDEETSFDINLGSEFALELGFPSSCRRYTEPLGIQSEMKAESSNDQCSVSSKKKKKKKTKKKNKK